MSVDVLQLRMGDFDEAMGFLNEVFGAHRPHNFATMLPSIYQPTDELMACNHAVRVDGQIKAIVGLFPISWQVGEAVLKVGGIGGVSTHESVRGAGYMKVLMNHCVASMRQQDYDLSWLGGQRQRYGYFGYEKCGTSATVTLTPTNLRHATSSRPDRSAAIDFEPMAATDTTALQFAYQLHEAQAIYCQRPLETFHRYLVSWYHQPHLARSADGAPMGYLVSNEDGSQVMELGAIDDETAIVIAAAWVRQHDQAVSFHLAPATTGLHRDLSALSEGMNLSCSGNWQIFDWARTVQALLQIRAASTGLCDGQVELGIEGYGALDIHVAAGQVTCTRSDALAAVTWSPFVAMRSLFGPLPPEAVTAVPDELAVLNGWCPLPLGWPRQDGV